MQEFSRADVWLPQSECTLVATGDLVAIAWPRAATAKDAFNRESIEYPTILLEYTSLMAQR